MLLRKILYQKNKDGGYSLFVNDEKVATLPVSEGSAVQIEAYVKFFYKSNPEADEIVIKNDSDGEPIGIIADAYKDGELIDTRTLWFDDYL